MNTTFTTNGIRYSLLTILKGRDFGDPDIKPDPSLVTPTIRRVIYGLAERREPKGFSLARQIPLDKP
jgi:hypothetical protein